MKSMVFIQKSVEEVRYLKDIHTDILKKLLKNYSTSSRITRRAGHQGDMGDMSDLWRTEAQ